MTWTRRLPALVVGWYLSSGMADSIQVRVVKDTAFVFGTCFVMFVVGFAWASVVLQDFTLCWPSRALVKAGAANVLGLLLMFFSVRSGDVSQTYAVKTSEPLYTTLLAMWMGERVQKRQMGAIAVICAGSMLLAAREGALLPDVASHPLPILLACVSNCALSMRTVLAKGQLVPRNAAAKANVPVAVFREMALASWAILLPCHFAELVWALAYDAPRLRLYLTWLPAMVIGASFYFVYNALGFTILEALSSSTFAVAKEFRCVFVYVWMLVWFRQPFSFNAGVGMSIVIGGSILYGRTLPKSAAPVYRLPRYV
eukprot:TRINITY_DN22129_c0_g1_i1.p1 TRINITY_DN22129_c0_g1~~TRINITY_DN22129_c0_g1_i1.p1  ORF type:complete len:313 (+),score=44.34 TRINITY_DN22129_c0_g1_i1:67-1005(+)